MHNNILDAAASVPAKKEHISPFRVGYNDCYTLLIADVNDLMSKAVTKVGEIWIGGDNDSIAAYTLGGLESGEPLWCSETSYGESLTYTATWIATRIVEAAEQLLAASKRRVKILDYTPTLGIPHIYTIDCDGIKYEVADYNGYQDAEFYRLKDDGKRGDTVYYSPRYPNGDSASDDWDNAKAAFDDRWAEGWRKLGIAGSLRRLTEDSVAKVYE